MFKLEVGGVYRNRMGECVRIVAIDASSEVFNHKGDDGSWYRDNGRYVTGILSDKDLVEKMIENTYDDEVNHPTHYTQGGIECIDAIQAQLTPEEFRGFLKGNVAKYLWREREKQGNVSLGKAQWYLNKLIQETE